MISLSFFIFAYSLQLTAYSLYAQEKKDEAIIVNGDTVEYSTDAKEVTATGNVSVIYKGSKLTCHKLSVNTQTKDAQAEGDVRLEDKEGIVEGKKIKYNFQTKKGIIIDSGFRANPYFGRAENVEKVSDSEFIANRGYFTTCSYDNPHYRIKSGKIDVFPNDKIQAKDNAFYIGKVPILYLPRYNHNLKDPMAHVQLTPGKKKEWGPYMLSAWRYSFTDNINGRIYLDYRTKLGVAEGFGANYKSENFGRGDFKYYYTQERDHTLPKDNSNPRIFQRYLIRWRHKWTIDERTDFTSEYYKITDSKMAIKGPTYNFLKDYFYREYEKDSQPLSYALLHHSFNYSSLDILVQKRTNRWYDPGYLEKLPEVKYSLPSYQILDSPFYFEDTTSAGSYNKKNTSTMTPTANDTNPDAHVDRLDTSNKLSIPMKVAFINFTPFVMDRLTFYDKKAVSASDEAPRTIFYGGADMSTKFYRIFDIKSNFLGLDINGLRHIITPTVSYTYRHEPTIGSAKLRQIDDVDTIDTSSNSPAFEISNKLQTKRNNKSVDFADLRINTSYVYKPKSISEGRSKRGSGFSDVLFDLRILPYSWMHIDADATYTHSGARSDPKYNHFSNGNYDINFDFGNERSFGVGQRYEIKGGNEITYDLKWRLTPKWKFSAYQRYYRGHETNRARGLREQEYTISRDLHCWTWDVTYNVKRGYGESIWFVFRLKAFPELEFNFNQDYHAPKPGSQSASVVR
ncbi:MAG: LPS export ABC transporter periplasmic protein LptC [Candidatus Omnitrophica bacterium]|nr:LPS export ABC transporter periplasmic protein LptC [Candidatus Omnitrophota bacterium]MDD5592001.1 LPS export ABC transporter periplasmic protein LptC [Candidatus Omnitrophota bacterium]